MLMMNQFDQEKILYILKSAGTPTPVRRIMSDFNRLSAVQKAGPTSTQPEVEAQLQLLVKQGVVRTQLGYNDKDKLYAFALEVPST